MSSFGTLLGPTFNIRNYKARIVANILGIDLATTPSFEMGVDNKTPEFLAKFPAGKAPVFEGVDGFLLSDSTAISFYVAMQSPDSDKLLGYTNQERAKILQYAFFAESELMPAGSKVFHVLFGLIPLVQPTYENAEKELARFLGVLDTLVGEKAFLVGDRITMADIDVACNLVLIYKQYLTAEDRSQYKNLTRYLTDMVSQPAFKEVIGEVVYCVERRKPSPPAAN
ncbi:Elongation factor 1-gamma [Coemansia sp. RSA 988]|nr:Elongation factor 1-gamma [Coemansia sp. RSA 988]